MMNVLIRLSPKEVLISFPSFSLKSKGLYGLLSEKGSGISAKESAVKMNGVEKDIYSSST